MPSHCLRASLLRADRLSAVAQVRTGKLISTHRQLWSQLLALTLLLLATPTFSEQVAGRAAAQAAQQAAEQGTEQVGRVIITAGAVQASADGGRTRELQRGDAVEVGDTITTDAEGRTQIRFIDGGLVSLRPNTEYHIDEFSFVAGQERQGATLRRGALTTLTGGAARKARDRYRLTTPLATIGVRGTTYEVALASSGELYLGVSEGAIRATATRSTGGRPGFADLGVGADYRFALFRPDGSIALLAARPALLESLSRVGPGRPGASRTPVDRDGSGRDTGGANGTPGKPIDRLGDALGGDLRKPGSSNFPALQPGDGARPGPGILPGTGLTPGLIPEKGSDRVAPPDGINAIKNTLSPLERGDVSLEGLRAALPPR